MRDGWSDSTLGQMARIRIGRTPPRNDTRFWTTDTSRPFCTIADMTGPTIAPQREGVTELAEAEGKAKRVPAGSLLMSFKLTIGRVGIAEVDVFPNEAIAWLEPFDQTLDKRYLALWLEASDVAAGSGRAVKGNTLNSDSLRAIPVAYPPIREQRRIVDLIDAVDRVWASASAEAHTLRLAHRTIREQMLSDARERVPLGDVIEGIEAGRSPDAEDRLPRGDEAVVLKVSAVRPGWFDKTQVKVVSDVSVFPDYAQVDDGDLLMVRANGNRDLLGVVCVAENVLPRCYLSDKTLRIVPKAAGPAALYLMECLMSGESRAQISSLGTGTASMKNISQASIRDIRVRLLPPLLQMSLVEITTGMRKATKQADRLMSSLVTLRSALLTDLLSGEHEIPESYDRFLTDVA